MDIIHLQDLEIYHSVLPSVKTNMYILLKEGEALVIDPHDNQELVDLLQQKNISNVTLFLTHEHPDHTCGIPMLEKYFKTTLICSKLCAEIIADKRNNRPLLMNLITDNHQKTQYYECHADITFDGDYTYDWHGIHFYFTLAPGHARGACFIKMDNTAIFTGDNLILKTPVITRFPGGNMEDFINKTKPYIDAIPDDMVILPGHGPMFQMKEERVCGN